MVPLGRQGASLRRKIAKQAPQEEPRRTMSNVATTIECRLMCATSCAYGIDPGTGTFDRSTVERFYQGVGYAADPVAISGGLEQIDAALVGRNGDDGIIVAFRGTIPPVKGVPISKQLPALLDWIQDIFLIEPEAVPGLPGKVHTGFFNAVSRVWDGIAAEVDRLQDSGKSTPVYFTGHSKGGPMASIAAMKAKGVEGLQPARVYTYASARPGDTDFAKGYEEAFSQTSYENYLDVVPFVPPSDGIIKLFAEIPLVGELFKKAEGWNYAPVGNRLYIKEDGDVVEDNGLLDDIRGAEIAAKLVGGKVGEIAAAHCHACRDVAEGCAGGYMQGACGTEVCGASS